MNVQALTTCCEAAGPDPLSSNSPRLVGLLGRLRTKPHNQQTFIIGHIAIGILHMLSLSLIPIAPWADFCHFLHFRAVQKNLKNDLKVSAE